MDNLIYSHLPSFFSIVQCIWSQTSKTLLRLMGLEECHLLWSSVMKLLNHALAWEYIEGAPSSFEVGLVLRHLQPWIDLWVGIVWIAPAVHLMVPLHLPKQGRHQCSAQSGARQQQECYRVLVSLKSWPGQLLSLNPCLRPKILARMLFFGDFVLKSSNSWHYSLFDWL